MDLNPLQFWLSGEAKKQGVTFQAPRSGDAGFDVRAAQACIIAPQSQMLVSTGLHLAIPLGWVGIVKDRSSMASKRIYTHGGVIDAGYRGEVKILISNSGQEPYSVNINDKLAQMLIVPYLSECEEVDTQEKLGATERGIGGFGSTGK